MAPGPALVVGLGNPGPEYAETRHNVGVRVVELLAARAGGGRFSKHKSNADVLEGRLAGRRAVLAEPRTYMNVSGGPVAGLLRYYGVEHGSGGGARRPGPRRSASCASSRAAARAATTGCGRSAPRSGRRTTCASASASAARRAARTRPTSCSSGSPRAERKELEFAVDLAADAAEALLRDGLEPAQNRFHALSG